MGAEGGERWVWEERVIRVEIVIRVVREKRVRMGGGEDDGDLVLLAFVIWNA